MNEWFTPSIVISIVSFLAACAGSFAVVKYQIGELKTALADLRRDVVSRGEYEAQIQALNNQLAQVVASINRMESRLDRVLDSHR